MKRIIFVSLLLLFLFVFHIRDGAAQGGKKEMGLSVEPGEPLIQKVPIGQLGVPQGYYFLNPKRAWRILCVFR
jgi:hypothetical protein